MDVLVTAVNECNDQRVQHSAAPAFRVGDQSQSPKIDLRKFSRLDLSHPHGDALSLLKPAVLDRKAVKRSVGDCYPLAPEQLVHFTEPKPAACILGKEPLANLLSVRD